MRSGDPNAELPPGREVSGDAPGTEQGYLADDQVRGERSAAPISRARSIQSRAGNILAGGLCMILGMGALIWYYANAFSRPDTARHRAQAAAINRAQGEMALPPLGRIDAPTSPASLTSPTAPSESTAQGVSAVLSGASAPSGATAPTDGDAAREAGVNQANAPTPPKQRVSDRRLSGAVFVQQSAGIASSSAPRGGQSDTGTLARVLPAQTFWLPKGAFIDCTLETAIDSSLPGMTTCVTATDTFGVDGTVVLLERGTKLVGETRGEVQQGASRVFVIWTEARTPTGVVVPLDSPGTDELGRSGLSGSVDRHFWERFGAAILITTIDGAVQSAVQSSARSGGTVVLSPSGSQGILTEVLKSTVNIAPTLTKKNGDRIQVLVARDVDFRAVYDLRAVATAR